MLRRIARKARTPDDPLVLVVDAQGQQEFDGFLARLHDERRQAEGIEAGWLGKGGGTVARLAGIIELLAWSGLASSGPPGHIGRDQVAAAVELWNGYFRPHARAVFDRATLTTSEGRVRRVARWLKDSGATVVSREDIRCRALGRTVNADGAQQVLYRLDSSASSAPIAPTITAGPGRPARRWQVNPALAGRVKRLPEIPQIPEIQRTGLQQGPRTMAARPSAALPCRAPPRRYSPARSCIGQDDRSRDYAMPRADTLPTFSNALDDSVPATGRR